MPLGGASSPPRGLPNSLAHIEPTRLRCLSTSALRGPHELEGKADSKVLRPVTRVHYFAISVPVCVEVPKNASKKLRKTVLAEMRTDHTSPDPLDVLRYTTCENRDMCESRRFSFSRAIGNYHSTSITSPPSPSAPPTLSMPALSSAATLSIFLMSKVGRRTAGRGSGRWSPGR